jgi:predicted HTH transcriptional regulator
MSNHLSRLLAQGEGSRLEFKRTLSSAYRIARTLAAFANTSGGTLLIGVDDSAQVVGILSEYQEVGVLEEAATFLIKPPLSFQYETITTPAGLVLAVNVPVSDERPHTVLDARVNRTIYVRQGDKSVPTDRLLPDTDRADPTLLQTPAVKTLLQFLRKNDSITPARLAQLVNFSEQRANKMLLTLAAQGVLLRVDRPKPAQFSLKK